LSLLFDENVSRRLVDLLKAEYPGSTHLEDLGLRGAQDSDIWELAKARSLALVTKDDDFRSLALLHGAPPKVVWLRVGNAGTQAIAELLRAHRARIATFIRDPDESLLILSAPSGPGT
jgi:predicted nuclease of predicted toxin-antitoxin system